MLKLFSCLMIHKEMDYMNEMMRFRVRTITLSFLGGFWRRVGGRMVEERLILFKVGEVPIGMEWSNGCLKNIHRR